MIVGMNYTNTGDRYITSIIYCATWCSQKIQKVAEALKQDCDEVYITPLDKNDNNFMNAIVLHGCRIGD